MLGLSHYCATAMRCAIFLVAGLTPFCARADVVISSDPTRNVVCSAGVCTPTKARAVLNVSQLTNMLVDEDVTIGTSAKAPNIRIDAPFSWTSAHQLRLQADGNIAVSRQVSDAGDGAIILVNRIGTLSFGKKGNIGFLGTSNPLTINGKSYLLAADVHSLAQLIARNPSGNFALARSYDAKADGRYSHSPIPTKFKGNLEGLGNTISNLHAECAGCGGTLGFIQQTAPSAVLANIRLASVKFGGTTYTGGLVGDNHGAVVLVSVDADLKIDSVKGHCTVAGGIAGLNTGTIAASQSSGTIAGVKVSPEPCFKLGGLAGVNAGPGWIHDSQSSVTVTAFVAKDGEVYAGGAVGDSSATVERVSASGAVAVNGFAKLGGLIGEMDSPGTLSKSLATGAVSQTNFDAGYLGGLVGVVEGATVDSDVSLSSVSGAVNCRCGGAIGIANQFPQPATLTNSVSYGKVTGGAGPYLDIGGFIGLDDVENNVHNVLSNDRWDMTTSGITDPSQGAGNVPNDPGITGFN